MNKQPATEKHIRVTTIDDDDTDTEVNAELSEILLDTPREHWVEQDIQIHLGTDGLPCLPLMIRHIPHHPPTCSGVP